MAEIIIINDQGEVIVFNKPTYIQQTVLASRTIQELIRTRWLEPKDALELGVEEISNVASSQLRILVDKKVLTLKQIAKLTILQKNAFESEKIDNLRTKGLITSTQILELTNIQFKNLENPLIIKRLENNQFTTNEALALPKCSEDNSVIWDDNLLDLYSQYKTKVPPHLLSQLNSFNLKKLSSPLLWNYIDNKILSFEDAFKLTQDQWTNLELTYAYNADTLPLVEILSLSLALTQTEQRNLRNNTEYPLFTLLNFNQAINLTKQQYEYLSHPFINRLHQAGFIAISTVLELTPLQFEYLITNTFIFLFENQIIDISIFLTLNDLQLQHLSAFFSLIGRGMSLKDILDLDKEKGAILLKCYALFYNNKLNFGLINTLTLDEARKLKILTTLIFLKNISIEQAIPLCSFDKKSLTIINGFIMQDKLTLNEAALLANDKEMCATINQLSKSNKLINPKKAHSNKSSRSHTIKLTQPEIQLRIEQSISRFLFEIGKKIELSKETTSLPTVINEELIPENPAGNNVDLAGLIEVIYNSEFIKFDVGSPVTYTAAADLIKQVDEALSTIRSLGDLDKLDQKSKEKMAIIELTAIHYHLFTTQNAEFITPKLKDCKKLFTSLGLNKPEINAWLDLLQTYVVCILQKKPKQHFEIITKINQLTNITLDKESTISQYKFQEIISTFYSILGLLHASDDVSLAIAAHSQALELRENNDKKQDVLSIYPAVTAMNLGALHLALGEYKKAKECFILSLNIYTNYQNANPSATNKITTLATLYFYLGESSKKLFENSEAKNYYKQALEIEKQFYGSDSNSQKLLREKISKCKSDQFFSVPESKFSKEPNQAASHLTITLEKYTAQPNAAKDSSNEKVLEALSNRSPR